MIGQTLGSYRIVEQVGMGGMATVYKAYDPGTDRYVAIKILPAHYSQDPTFRERFRREAKAIARLEHPHILPIHAYGEEGDTAYLLMRFLPTGTLKQRIERGALPYGEASAMLTQIADGLDYAHKRGILHRDIKPSNILLDESGNAYLSDFGIARMIGSAGDLTGTGMLGTPAYMSPEQCAGSRDLSPASDQYALGVVLYEMVTGRTPFQAETPLALIQMHLSAPLPPPHLLRPDLPEAVEGVILKTLSRSPLDRWTTCSEMADAFNRAIGESGIAAYTPPMRSGETTAEGVELTFGETMPAPPPTVKAKSRGVPIWMLGLAGVVVVGLIVGGLALAGVLGTQAANSGSPVSDHEATLTMSAGTAQSMAGTASVQLTSQASQGGGSDAPTPTATQDPLALGERLDWCGSDLCFYDSSGGQTPANLGKDFMLFSGPGHGYSLSPDGSQIVFSGCPVSELSADPNCRGDIYVANRDGTNPVKIYGTPDHYDLRPAWSPDGQEIVFNEGWTIWSIKPGGSGLKQIAFGELVAESYYYAWSPDSQQIAWASGRHKEDGAPDWDRLYVMSRDGSGLRSLLYSPDPYMTGQVAWSPDGQSLAVEFLDGKTYLFNTNCDTAPGGCDPATATTLDEIPKHWLLTFSPQWAGEPEAEAIRAGCQSGERVLYYQNFEDPAAVTQVGAWTVGEAPGGGLALHGKAQGEFANYPLISNNISETRIRLLVMPITDSWLINFRESSTQALGNVKYDFIQFRDRARLTKWDNETWIDLVSSPPLSINEWSIIEIVWEAANTVVVRLNGIEALRYVETATTLDQGVVTLWLASQYEDAVAEAWFDDIVICGK